MIVRELLTRFSFSTDTASQSRVEGAIQRIGGLLGGLAAFASLRSLATVADSMQSLEARIGMLPQTLGDVGDAFNKVGQHALATRTPLAAYGQLYVKIGNAAKAYITDQTELLQVTDTIANSLVVGGATANEASSAMLQFAQALGAGALAGEEFRAMAEATPQYMDQLAVAMGFPREQLKKMASDGKLTAKLVIEATKKMSDYFERRAKQMPMTIGQAVSDVGTRFGMMVQNMNRKSGVVTAIAETIIAGFKGLEETLKKIIKYAGGADNALKLLKITLYALAVPLSILLGRALLGGIASIVLAILSPLGLLITGLIFVGLLVDDFMTYMRGGESALGDFIDTLTSGEQTLMSFINILLLLGLAAATVFKVIRLKIMQTIGNYILLGFTALVAGAKMALAGIAAIAPFLLFIAILALALGAFFGFAYLIKTYWDDIKKFATKAIDSIGGAISSIGAVFKDIFYDTPIRWISEMITNIVAKLKGIGKTIMTAVGLGDDTATATLRPMGAVRGGSVPNATAATATQSVRGGPMVTRNQTINLTVPAGTPESQQKAIKTAAATAFNDPMKGLSNDLAMVGA